MTATGDVDSLRAEVDGTFWYHTLDLPGGVVTPGYFDLRKLPDRILPADLSGKRCLDACTASGFWAFEMERRGASEVVAIDIPSFADQDWQIEAAAPTDPEVQRSSFEVARQALGFSASRRDCSVYDASPEVLGEFDFVFIGSVLIHLRDPVRALRALRTVTRGELRSFDIVMLWSSLLRPHTPRGRLYVGDDPRWWTPNTAGHRRWLEAAGFDVERDEKYFFQPFGRIFDKVSSQGVPLRTKAHTWMYQHVGAPSQLLVCR